MRRAGMRCSWPAPVSQPAFTELHYLSMPESSPLMPLNVSTSRGHSPRLHKVSPISVHMAATAIAAAQQAGGWSGGLGAGSGAACLHDCQLGCHVRLQVQLIHTVMGAPCALKEKFTF